MKFTKMEGAGNDYVYVDARSLDADWPEVSRLISDRHFGIGSDGLILIMDSDKADLKMRMFNADGSEGEMCGNGIRCFTKYAIERDIVPATEKGVTVETLAGIRTVVPILRNGKVVKAKVAMGMPHLTPAAVPVKPEDGKGSFAGKALVNYPLSISGVDLNLAFVSMGNPHAVAFIDQPVAEFPLHSIGPLMEHHKLFPKRVNFEIVNVIRQGRFDARVWERGSGETMACGTGACAIAVAAHILDINKGAVDIKLPGGLLTITWDGQGEVYLEGPAVEVFTGEWNVN